jgi:hypothetical protein
MGCEVGFLKKFNFEAGKRRAKSLHIMFDTREVIFCKLLKHATKIGFLESPYAYSDSLCHFGKVKR